MRKPVSIDEINDYFIQRTPIEKRAELFPQYVNYMPKLYKTMELPSYVHGYCLAIEYMRSWFLKKFPKDPSSPTKTYFKTVYVNGSHILDNWKNWNNYNIKREKPMLAIVPTVNTDYDRDNVDLYMGDAGIMLRKSTMQDSFFKDYNSMSFLYVQLREMEMNFTFKVRVNSRSEQLDLLNKMELWFRIGTTQQDRISADFHIPTDILVQIAKDNAFEVDENDNIVDVPAFLNYMNKHSSAPVIFKMRAINQHPEFFVRARELYTHISTKDKIQIDDGEQDGHLNTNYHLEMNVVLHMPIPHFYAYMAQIPLADSITISERKPSMGIYTINNFDIKPQNEQGWPSIMVTSYFAEKDEKVIDISPVFDSNTWPVAKVLHYDQKLGITPEGYLDIRIMRNDMIGGRMADARIDYRNLKIYLDESIDKECMFDIVIYADMEYVNSQLISLESYDKSRVSSAQLSKPDIGEES